LKPVCRERRTICGKGTRRGGEKKKKSDFKENWRAGVRSKGKKGGEKIWKETSM